MRRALLLAAVALAGCGGNSAPRVARATPPPPSKIESFAHVRLPASTRDLESKDSVGIDESVSARFTIDRGDVDAFVHSTGFSPPLSASYKPYSYHEIGWHLNQIRHLVGGEDTKDGISRWLVIDLDQPKVATVYLLASET